MPRSTTGLAYATLGVAILGTLIFLVFVTVPAWAAWRTARVHLRNQTLSLEQHRQFLANVDARSAELKRYEADARVLAVGLPNSSSAADLAAVLAALAEHNGLIVTLVSGPTQRQGAGPQSVSGKNDVYETVVKLNGTYAGMSGFLREMEKSARLVDVPLVDLSARTDGTIEGTLHLLTYTIARRDTGSVILPVVPQPSAQPIISEPSTP